VHVVVTLRVAEHLAAGLTRIDDLATVAESFPGSPTSAESATQLTGWAPGLVGERLGSGGDA